MAVQSDELPFVGVQRDEGGRAATVVQRNRTHSKQQLQQLHSSTRSENELHMEIKRLTILLKSVLKENCKLHTEIKGYHAQEKLLTETKQEVQQCREEILVLRARLKSFTETQENVNCTVVNDPNARTCEDASNLAAEHGMNNCFNVPKQPLETYVIPHAHLLENTADIKPIVANTDLITHNEETILPSSDKVGQVVKQTKNECNKSRSLSPTSQNTHDAATSASISFEVIPDSTPLSIKSIDSEVSKVSLSSSSSCPSLSTVTSSLDSVDFSTDCSLQSLSEILSNGRPSALSKKIAQAAAEAIRTDRKLHLQRVANESLITEYEKLKKKLNIIIPEIKRQSITLRQENECLREKYEALHQQYMQLKTSNATEFKEQCEEVTPVEALCAANEFQNEEQLSHRIKALEEANLKLKQVHFKWDKHNQQQNDSHQKQIADLNKNIEQLQQTVGKQQAQAHRKEKIYTVWQKTSEDLQSTLAVEIKKREKAQKEIVRLKHAKTEDPNPTQFNEPIYDHPKQMTCEHKRIYEPCIKGNTDDDSEDELHGWNQPLRTPWLVPAGSWQWKQNKPLLAKWYCHHCTFANEPSMAYCEICEAPKPRYACETVLQDN